MDSKNTKNSLQNWTPKSKNFTDALWIYLFSVFWFILIVIIVFSMIYGNYNAVIYGVDSYGNVCNQTHNKHFENFPLSGINTLKKPFLLYFDIENFDGVVKICVADCPIESLTSTISLHWRAELQSSLCSYDVNVLKEAVILKELRTNEEPLLNRRGPCPFRTTRSIHFKNRCLIDEKPREVLKSFYDLLNSGGLDQLFFIAVYQSWTYVALFCGFALVISLIILALMFWLTKILAWLICLLTIITNAALTAVLWLAYNKYPLDEDNEDEDNEDNEMDTNLMYEKYRQNLKLMIFPKVYKKVLWDFLDEYRVNNIIVFGSAVLSTLLTIILIATTLKLRKPLNRLKLVFDEAVVCLKDLSSLIIVQIIALLSMIVLIFLSGYTLLCLTTAKFPITSSTIDPLYNKSADSHSDRRLFQQIEYVDSKTIRRTFWIYIIGMLWTTEFIFAFEEFCIGAAVGFWYFTPSINNPSLHGIGVLFKYHLGTIAKGSAIISLVRVPRLILTAIFKSIKTRISQLWLQRLQNFEESIGIWNHNAYVPVAMGTTDLRQAAEVAFKISSKNSEQVESINNVFDFVIFLSKFLVATITCLLSILLLKDRKDYLMFGVRDDNFFYMAPVLFSTFCAFCIAHIVFSMFEMTVDVLILCICEDNLMNGRPKRFMMKSNLTKLFEGSREKSCNQNNVL